MNAQATALYFADALNKHRSLTDWEADMLVPLVQNRERTRQRWTLTDTRQLRKLMAKGCTRREIAQTMGRSCFTIDKRIRRIKGGARG